MLVIKPQGLDPEVTGSKGSQALDPEVTGLKVQVNLNLKQISIILENKFLKPCQFTIKHSERN